MGVKNLDVILKGCINNDSNCQEKLYRHYYSVLFALCKNFFSDPHDILTALNNGILKVFRNVTQYDSSKGEFFNWMYTIVKNAALTLMRNKKKGRLTEWHQCLDDCVANCPFKQLEWKDIYYFIGKMPANTREVCSLYYLQGFSIKEIAKTIDMKEGTVKWHLNECRNRLKIIFEKK